MKKAQSLSINVIIIAALGLAILAILIMIVTGKIGAFTKGIEAEQELQKCPGVIKGIYDCNEPLLGNYGKLDSKTNTVVKLSPNEVCCKK